MSEKLYELPVGNWYTPTCALCGTKVDYEDPSSYRAVSTILDEDIEGINPTYEGGSVRKIQIGKLTVSTTRRIGTRRRVHLVHYCCKTLVTETTLSPALIAIVTPNSTQENADLLTLSSLDEFTMLNMFHKDRRPLSTYTFGKLFDLPAELFDMILSSCPANKALPFALKYDAIFHFKASEDALERDYALGPTASTILKGDAPRHRIATAIHALHILPRETLRQTFTQRRVELLPQMRATFVERGGVKYLYDICGKQAPHPEHLCAEEINFTIAIPQILFLQVHDLGITNIAFAADIHGRPRWIRETSDVQRIFVHRSKDAFTAIMVVSDPLKWRMVDVLNYDSPHPRPLLPWNTGFWTSQSLQSERTRYLQLEGYFEPTFTDISTCQSVYVVVARYISNFCGIYTQPQPNTEAQKQCYKIDLSLERTVRLMYLEMTALPFQGIVFLQL
ncbi:hypothetical protein A1F97_05634 [Pyrenophora tritici-repentis]|nr:hypothetical protein A1F97_05634 [Pyrenophora tritici-repentis]